jgi:hypothetical protein
MPVVRLRPSGATCAIEFTGAADVQAAGELQREMLAFGISGDNPNIREYLRIAGLSCHFPDKAPVQ